MELSHPSSRSTDVSRAFLKVTRRIRHACRSLLGLPRSYQFGAFAITLPASHALWMYQAEHAHYDRFLPHLAKFVRADQAIIDVGANVGDSLAAMISMNQEPTYVCVEADDTFYRYLTENISRIKRRSNAAKIHAIKCLVGKSIGAARMEGAHGTKHAVPVADGASTSRPLDEILATVAGMPKVRLMKTDVDGFDYDVIDSSLSLIEKDKPLLFFESQYTTELQKAGFEKMLSTLTDRGYVDWSVFDNFGQLMLRTGDSDAVAQLMDYSWRQNRAYSTRTVYYVDVLASQSHDRDFVSKVLASY